MTRGLPCHKAVGLVNTKLKPCRGMPNARGFDVGQSLAEQNLRPKFPDNSFMPTADKPVPTLQDWVNNNGGNFFHSALSNRIDDPWTRRW